MNQEFYKLAKQCHEERIREEHYKEINLDHKAKGEYAKFYCWSQAFKNGKTDINTFKQYLKKQPINFWVKKKILELYYNLKFSFDYETKKWVKAKEQK